MAPEQLTSGPLSRATRANAADPLQTKLRILTNTSFEKEGSQAWACGANALNKCPSHVNEKFSSLSLRLREESAALHRRLEVVLQLPDAITGRQDYQAWLCRYLGFYAPLEHTFSEVSGWDLLGIELGRHAQAGRLSDDLAALGVDRTAIPYASRTMLPQLPTFAHALGSLYVIEGARLGGRSMLGQLKRRIGTEIAGATHFFGAVDGGGMPWQSFRTALDAFGQVNPQLCTDAVAGAQRTFISLENWFTPICAKASLSREYF
jgi:heme oxygenase